MKLLCDTREQTPWPAPKGREMVRVCLPFGDYSLEGFTERVCVERKSLDDYVGSVFGDWTRFSSRLAEFRALDLACVVVEAWVKDVTDLKYRPDRRSSRRLGPCLAMARRLDALEPQAVLASAAKIYAEFRVPVFWAGPPTVAARFGFRVLDFWHDRERAKQA